MAQCKRGGVGGVQSVWVFKAKNKIDTPVTRFGHHCTHVHDHMAQAASTLMAMPC